MIDASSGLKTLLPAQARQILEASEFVKRARPHQALGAVEGYRQAITAAAVDHATTFGGGSLELGLERLSIPRPHEAAVAKMTWTEINDEARLAWAQLAPMLYYTPKQIERVLEHSPAGKKVSELIKAEVNACLCLYQAQPPILAIAEQVRLPNSVSKRKIIRAVEAIGGRVENGAKHYKVFEPGGRFVGVMSHGPGDMWNVRAQPWVRSLAGALAPHL